MKKQIDIYNQVLNKPNLEGNIILLKLSVKKVKITVIKTLNLHKVYYRTLLSALAAMIKSISLNNNVYSIWIYLLLINSIVS